MSWSKDEHNRVIEALAVTCELTGTSLSDAAKRHLIDELSEENSQQVLLALRRSSRECKGRLTLAAILAAMKDEDRKEISDDASRRSAYLTTLRGCALVEMVPWYSNCIEEVERALTAKGYKCDKMPGYAARQEKKAKSLPHWQEEKDRE